MTVGKLSGKTANKAICGNYIGGDYMKEILLFIGGAMLGGFIATLIFCFFAIRSFNGDKTKDGE